MKKILIIGMTERMGGVETFIYNTTSNLQGEELSFDFLVHGTDKMIFENEISKYPNTNIFYFKSIKRRPISVSFKLWKFYIKNRKKYDYIHFQSGITTEILYVFPFCLFTKAKVISHSHCGGASTKINKFLNALFRPILNMISYKRISCSDEAAKWLFGKNKEYIMLNNGVDIKKFEYSSDARNKIRQEYEIGNETYVIGHIGRFSELKNHEFLLQLAQRLKHKSYDFKMMFVGTGEIFDEIQEKIKNRNLSEYIICPGVKSNVSDFYSTFDVFAMPSFYEGLPIVGVEAQTSGLNCLFSNNISRQVLLSDRAKMLELDIDKWEKEITGYIDDKKKVDRKKYSEVIDKKEFSLNATCKKLKEVYMN